MDEHLRDLELARLRAALRAALAEIALLHDRIAWLEQRSSRLLDIDIEDARRKAEEE